MLKVFEFQKLLLKGQKAVLGPFLDFFPKKIAFFGAHSRSKLVYFGVFEKIQKLVAKNGYHKIIRRGDLFVSEVIEYLGPLKSAPDYM